MSITEQSKLVFLEPYGTKTGPAGYNQRPSTQYFGKANLTKRGNTRYMYSASHPAFYFFDHFPGRVKGVTQVKQKILTVKCVPSNERMH